MKFSFIGEFSLDPFKENNIRKGTTANGTYLTLRPSIVVAKNNRGFCEIFGMKQKIIKVRDQEGNNVELDWEDRFDPDKIKDIRKYVISIGKERHEFVSKYDFNEWILEHLDEVKGKRVLATGWTRKDFYQGTSRDTFPIDNIYEIGEEDDRKNILSITSVIYWNKEGIDVSEFKSQKKIYINGYTDEYISKTIGHRFVAQQFVLDCSKYNLESEAEVKQMKARMIQFGLTYDGGKIGSKVKKDYVSNEFEVQISNGAEEVEFTIDQCTEMQKMFIELGMKTLEDFKPKGTLYGNRVLEYRIKDPTLLGQYDKGFVVYKGDLEDLIYVPAQDEKAEDVFPEDAMNLPEEPDSEPEDNDEEDDVDNIWF